MSLLVESIKILNGRCYHLALHEARANHSRYKVFGVKDKLQLKQHIQVPETYRHGLVKCRVTYDTQIQGISFNHYHIRDIRNIKIVETKDLHYADKWEQRTDLDVLYAKRQDADEIMIINNGLVTDGYYYNLVFEKDGRFFTPKTPLLQGVQRASLLKRHKIEMCDITKEEILTYDNIHYINALTPLGRIVVDIRNGLS
jgi:4-amino-4-deoxychorismate lyase